MCSRVGRLNTFSTSIDNQYKQFLLAKDICNEEFDISMKITLNTWYPSYKEIWPIIVSTLKNNPEAKILELHKSMPFHDVLFEYESSVNPTPFKFVIYPDNVRNIWTYTAINIHAGSFRIRCKMPDEWCGKRDNELSQISNIPGCIFVHHTGFKGANHTYQGILAMVQGALCGL